ncbi:DUF1579 family protein [Hymenobacter negativus]|uniref:DUF1579 family protein n=1 Tax=Hymenobacter negativus TaxID=2795026 RepID=A0ABS3QG29_9BACT|nr:DUF1579 family protein [Hymenobacter negativus]MBO2009744.1 DUF1579 family protein [Hymenobacter negativus]
MKASIPSPDTACSAAQLAGAKRLFPLLLLLVVPSAAAFAQAKPAAPASQPAASAAKEETMKQLLDYSRPGSNHALLSSLVGSWTFQDAARPFVKGTVRRTPLYGGRFYTVAITGGNLQVPVADGKMEEQNYQGMQTEGYDNGRRQFVTTSINNHIGSGIETQTGTYDAARKAFTYEWESELITGQRQKNKRVLRLIDTSHYAEDYYEIRNGAEVKVRELVYTKTKEE